MLAAIIRGNPHYKGKGVFNYCADQLLIKPSLTSILGPRGFILEHRGHKQRCLIFSVFFTGWMKYRILLIV